MTLDDFHNKKYHATEYNCSHFVRDLYLFLTGGDIAALVGAWNTGDLSDAMKSRDDLTVLNGPKEGCIVWFQKPKTPPHVGIYLEGKIFHMTPEGPRLHPFRFVSNKYAKVKFYTCH